MKFKSAGCECDTIAQVIDCKIARAPDYYAGQIEALQAEVFELQRIVGLIAGNLPHYDQVTLADQLGFEHHDESER